MEDNTHGLVDGQEVRICCKDRQFNFTGMVILEEGKIYDVKDDGSYLKIENLNSKDFWVKK